MPTGATLAPRGAAILPTGAVILPVGAMLAPQGAVVGESGNTGMFPGPATLARLQRPRMGASKLALTGAKQASPFLTLVKASFDAPVMLKTGNFRVRARHFEKADSWGK